MSEPEPIRELREELGKNRDLKELLLKSLKQAQVVGKRDLEPRPYDALPWPLTVDEYLQYLTEYLHFVPCISGTGVQVPWGGTENDAEELDTVMFQRLAHIHWLTDQYIDGKLLQDDVFFSKWLATYYQCWGAFLDTPESFSPEILECYISRFPQWRVQDSMIDGKPNTPSGWLTFNQFFARRLNAGLRPIQDPWDNTVVTSPVDCVFKKVHTISDDSLVPPITIKKFRHTANVHDLLHGSPFAEEFAGGLFVHLRLQTFSYHCFHTTVSGVLRELQVIPGCVDADPVITNGQFEAPPTNRKGFQFVQARGVAIMDTSGSPSGDIGLVAIIPVGIASVSSVRPTAVVGATLQKGDELGFFAFGGSDLIVLLRAEAKPEVVNDMEEQYLHYGTQFAKCSLKA